MTWLSSKLHQIYHRNVAIYNLLMHDMLMIIIYKTSVDFSKMIYVYIYIHIYRSTPYRAGDRITLMEVMPSRWAKPLVPRPSTWSGCRWPEERWGRRKWTSEQSPMVTGFWGELPFKKSALVKYMDPYVLVGWSFHVLFSVFNWWNNYFDNWEWWKLFYFLIPYPFPWASLVPKPMKIIKASPVGFLSALPNGSLCFQLPRFGSWCKLFIASYHLEMYR